MKIYIKDFVNAIADIIIVSDDYTFDDFGQHVSGKELARLTQLQTSYRDYDGMEMYTCHFEGYNIPKIKSSESAFLHSNCPNFLCKVAEINQTCEYYDKYLLGQKGPVRRIDYPSLTTITVEITENG